MVDTKITELGELTTIANDDVFVVVDVSDTTQGSSGSTKKIVTSNLSITASQVSDFDTEVSNNTTVAAKLNNVVEDTTPQLGGSLDLNDEALTRIETADVALGAGNLCYLTATGYALADASAEATADSDLLLANATIGLGATGEFIEYGEYVTTGLTAGAIYYMSETAGAITATAPTTSGSIVRVVGYAKSTTVFVFKPDTVWIEVA